MRRADEASHLGEEGPSTWDDKRRGMPNTRLDISSVDALPDLSLA